MDPIWLAMVLGAQANLRPTAYDTVQNGSIAPEKAYFQLKQAIREKSNIDVNILDNGPGSPERRQILAEGLKQSNLTDDAEVRQRARLMLESVLRRSPRTILAARFSEKDVRQALQALAERKGNP